MAEKAQLHEHLVSVVVGEHKAACSRLGGQKTGRRVQTPSDSLFSFFI